MYSVVRLGQIPFCQTLRQNNQVKFEWWTNWCGALIDTTPDLPTSVSCLSLFLDMQAQMHWVATDYNITLVKHRKATHSGHIFWISPSLMHHFKLIIPTPPWVRKLNYYLLMPYVWGKGRIEQIWIFHVNWKHCSRRPNMWWGSRFPCGLRGRKNCGTGYSMLWSG